MIQYIGYRAPGAARAPFWTFVRRLGREAVLVAIYCLLMLFLPPKDRLDLRPIRLGATSALMNVQDQEFFRWSRNEVNRRSHLRRHLSASPPGGLIRLVPELSRAQLDGIYDIYTVILGFAVAAGVFAIIGGATQFARLAWSLIACASTLMFGVLLTFGWPSLFFVIYFLVALHLFFAVYAITMLKVLKQIDAPLPNEPIRQPAA